MSGRTGARSPRIIRGHCNNSRVSTDDTLCLIARRPANACTVRARVRITVVVVVIARARAQSYRIGRSDRSRAMQTRPLPLTDVSISASVYARLDDLMRVYITRLCLPNRGSFYARSRIVGVLRARELSGRRNAVSRVSIIRDARRHSRGHARTTTTCAFVSVAESNIAMITLPGRFPCHPRRVVHRNKKRSAPRPRFDLPNLARCETSRFRSS